MKLPAAVRDGRTLECQLWVPRLTGGYVHMYGHLTGPATAAPRNGGGHSRTPSACLVGPAYRVPRLSTGGSIYPPPVDPALQPCLLASWPLKATQLGPQLAQVGVLTHMQTTWNLKRDI